jgi:hypothetical protein
MTPFGSDHAAGERNNSGGHPLDMLEGIETPATAMRPFWRQQAIGLAAVASSSDDSV